MTRPRSKAVRLESTGIPTSQHGMFQRAFDSVEQRMRGLEESIASATTPGVETLQLASDDPSTSNEVRFRGRTQNVMVTTLTKEQPPPPAPSVYRNVVVLLPPAAEHVGRAFRFTRTTGGAETIELSPKGSDTINGASGTYSLATQYQTVTLFAASGGSAGGQWFVS